MAKKVVVYSSQSWEDNKCPGRMWLRRMRKRHECLLSIKPKAITSFNHKKVKIFF
jgi:hypothetical protein